MGAVCSARLKPSTMWHYWLTLMDRGLIARRPVRHLAPSHSAARRLSQVLQQRGLSLPLCSTWENLASARDTHIFQFQLHFCSVLKLSSNSWKKPPTNVKSKRKEEKGVIYLLKKFAFIEWNERWAAFCNGQDFQRGVESPTIAVSKSSPSN